MNESGKRERFKFYLWVGLFWLLIWLLISLTDHPGSLVIHSFNQIWRAFYIIVLNIIFFEYTLFQATRKTIIKFILVFIAHMMLFTLGMHAWILIGSRLHIYNALNPEELELGFHCGYSIGSIFFFGIIKHIYDYRKLKEAAQKLRIEKQEAELNYLKSQTNPHFLFNTLNNIYSLARDKSDLTPESILRLSQILRFMLYETGGAFISIEQELKIISDYIALEKLRYDDSLVINFNYDIEDPKQALPPLLLIPLVENAFKHGVSETRNRPFVEIHLSVKNSQLVFLVKNSIEPFSGETKVKENIGLSNLRRQLELLYKDYTLSVQQGESVFSATLNINLSSHV